MWVFSSLAREVCNCFAIWAEVENNLQADPTDWVKNHLRMKLEYSLTPYTKINSKWIKDLNVRPDTIKLLEETIGRTLYDIKHSKIPFDPPPREMEIKTKINKWDLMKLKSFCTAKENINKTKRQPTEWEKIFANN